MDATKIEWADATWNPIKGCSRVSEGCRNCYAEGIAARFSGKGQPYEGLATMTASGPRWTNKIAVDEKALPKPLSWKKPRRIFVNSMSDLFHESVTSETVDRVFLIMAWCARHQFLVLTKRPERMRDYIEAFDESDLVDAEPFREASYRVSCDDLPNETMAWHKETERLETAISHARLFLNSRGFLPNLWLGVSVEDQATANERIPLLLDTLAAVRFISAEPLLGPVTLKDEWLTGLHWVIAGGESGRNARPMHPDWARGLRDRCVAARVPFFFKQWGEWHPCEMMTADNEWICVPMPGHAPFDYTKARIYDPRSDTGWNWRLLGKRAAGHLLDGREWNEMPEVRA